MADNLDQWIKDSKVETPDSGEFRRLNRVLLKDRIAVVVPARRRRFRFILVVISLALLSLLSGQISQLGSDSFDMNKTTEYRPVLDDSVTVYENVFRGGSVNLPRDFSEADVDEYQRSVAAGEGTVVKATGLSFGGATFWLKYVTRDINGRENTEGRATKNPPSQEPENIMQFLQEHYQDLVARTKTDPPHGTQRLTLDGILFEFDIWTYEYPGFGAVTCYIGFPVS
jgi:hypothetical protein